MNEHFDWEAYREVEARSNDVVEAFKMGTWFGLFIATVFLCGLYLAITAFYGI